MKKRKIQLLVVSVFIIGGIFLYGLHKNNNLNIEKILNSKNYSYLSTNVKNYVRNYYNETGKLLLTEKNKKNNEVYLNPDYIEYLDGNFETTNGYIPDILTSDYEIDINAKSINNLPKKYDSRNVNGNNYVTPTKRQYSELCWNYAYTSAIESKLLKEGLKTDHQSLNLSERMMDYATTDPISAIDIEKNPYFGNYTLKSLAEGGNEYRYTSVLVNGLFPIEESDWIYDLEYMGKVRPEDIYDFNKTKYQVNEVKYLKDNNLTLGFDENTNKILKQAIIDNGSVGVSLRVGAGKNFLRYLVSEEEKLNADSQYNYLYYKSANALYQSNDHMVTLIGWDDEFSKNVCVLDTGELKEPTNNNCTEGNPKTINGVWITKDSANSSYHYLAYETVNSTYFYVTDISVIDWDNVYASANKESYTKDGAQYTFIKQNYNEKLKSIKFYSYNVISNVKVYVNANDGLGDHLVATINTDTAGMYTIPITNEINLQSNTFTIKFSNGNLMSEFAVFTTNSSNNSLLNIEDGKVVNSFNYQGLLNGYQNVIVTNGISRNINTSIIYIIRNNKGEDVTNMFSIIRNNPIGNYVNTLIKFNNNLPFGEYTAYAYVNNNLLDTFKINIEYYMENISGDGSDTNPFIITNPTQLNMMRLNMYNYYKLGNDIDLTYDTQNENGLFYNDGLGWEPISYSDCTAYADFVSCSSGFSGAFDGNNYKITGLYINRPNEDFVGLFKNTYNDNYSGLHFRNFTLKDVNITGKNYVGGLIGYAYGTTYERTLIFENISVTGNIKGNEYVGGIIGYFKGGTGLNNYLIPETNCIRRHCLQSLFNSATIEANNYSGGIIGLLETQDYYNFDNPSWRSTITANYWQNSGTIKSNNKASGLIGHVNIKNGNTVTIENSITTGKVQSTSNAGIVNDMTCKNSSEEHPDCNLVLNNIYYINEVGYNTNELISTSNVKKYNILDFTNYDIFNSFTNFNTYFKTETIDNIKRIPFLKNAYKEYTKAEDISINTRSNISIFDYIEGNKNINYSILDESVATIDNTGIITPLKNGSTTIHVTSYYDGYDKDLNLTVEMPDIVYTITYNLNGGTANNKTTYTVSTESFTLTNPTKEGYKFIGWTGSNGEIKELEVTIEKGTTGDLIYTAHYEPLKYTVEFFANGGEGVMDKQIFTHNVESRLNNNKYIKEGYFFKNWNTKADGTGINYSNEQTIKITTDMKLYAIWDEEIDIVINKYTVDEELGIIKNVSLNTTEDELKNNINLGTSYSIEIIKQKEHIGTNSQVKIYKNEKLYKEYVVIVKGDITGDGIINLADLSKFYNYYQQNITMNKYFEIAADVNESGNFSLADLSKFYNYYQGNINNL